MSSIQQACVLLTGCGGAAAVGVTRSLARTGKYRLVGTDCNLFALPFGEVGTRYLVPSATHPDFIPALNEIIETERIDFIHPQPDAEVLTLSAHRARLKARLLLPPHRTIEVCQDKYESARQWERAGVPTPRTVLLSTPNDLVAAFDMLLPPFWVRFRHGYGGRGSYIARELEATRCWIDYHRGWGEFTASELLPGRLLTWQSVWFEGELICSQGRERLSWMMGSATASGVSGMTRAARTAALPDLDEIAQASVLAVDAEPHGIFGVDLKQNAMGTLCPTEINVGRFFTTIQFFTELGLNMPDIFLSAALSGAAPAPPQRCNPLPPDWYWLRSADSSTILLRACDLTAQPGRAGDVVELGPDATITYGVSQW